MLRFSTHSRLALWAAFFYAPLWAFTRSLFSLLIFSLPITVIISFFAGAVLITHAQAALSVVGGGPVSGYITSLAGVRELFPLLALSALAARAGSEITSEIAILKLSRQVDAVESMGISIYQLVIGPRVLACLFGSLVLVPCADLAGLAGIYVVGTQQLSMNAGDLLSSLLIWLRPSDLGTGLLKGLVFSGWIGMIATFEGLSAQGGASGIGRAASRAVVNAMIAGYISCFLLSYWIYGHSTLGNL